MFDRLTALAHGVRVLVETLLHRLQHMFVLPTRDPPLLAGRAARLERTVAACIGPIAPKPLLVLLVRVVVLQIFAGRTAIHVFVAEIDEVLLAEATPCLNARGHRFGERHGNAGFVTSEDLLAAVVTPIGNSFEFVERCWRVALDPSLHSLPHA